MNNDTEYFKFAAGYRARFLREQRRQLRALDDHMLKDIGLFLEHLPNGASNYRRR